MILFHQEQIQFEVSQKLVHKKWLKAIAEGEGCQIGALNYIFCDDAYLLSINQAYLNHDTYTDIITFDYREGRVLNSDIFISIERVQENAVLYDTSFEAELYRVMAHGLLHLCGYKDKTKKEQEEMRRKEQEALDKMPLLSNV